MIGFLADENFNRRIVRGLWRRNPRIDIALAQEVGLGGVNDETVLTWAAEHQRVVLSHDRRTMVRDAWQRVRSGKPMGGVLLIDRRVPVNDAIEELLVISECSWPEEWEGVVDYVSLSSRTGLT